MLGEVFNIGMVMFATLVGIIAGAVFFVPIAQRKPFVGGLSLGLFLGMFIAVPMLAWVAYRSDIERAAENEKALYCAIWQSKNVEECMKGKVK